MNLILKLLTWGGLAIWLGPLEALAWFAVIVLVMHIVGVLMFPSKGDK